MNPAIEGTVARPASQRRQAEHQLEVLGDEDVGPEGHQSAQRVSGQRRAEGRNPEEAQVDQGIGQPACRRTKSAPTVKPAAIVTAGSQPTPFSASFLRP